MLARYAEAGGTVNAADQESALAAVILEAGTPGTVGARIVEETICYLGAAIGGLVNLLNPERVILGGWAGLLLGETYLDAIREAARGHALRHPFATTSIELCTLGPDAVALGAAPLPLELFLRRRLARAGGRTGPAPRDRRTAASGPWTRTRCPITPTGEPSRPYGAFRSSPPSAE